MPRCKKQRMCRYLEENKIFKPAGIPKIELELLEIEIDEFEALRLCDLEGKSQIEAGESMKVSRATIQRLLNSARAKVVDALLNSKMLKINAK